MTIISDVENGKKWLTVFVLNPPLAPGTCKDNLNRLLRYTFCDASQPI